MNRLTAIDNAWQLPRHGELIALVPVVVAIISLASFLLLVQTSRVAALGYEIHQLGQIREEWIQRNYELEAEIATLQSLDRIEREAKARFNMIPATKYVYVSVDKPSQASASWQMLPPSYPKLEDKTHRIEFWERLIRRLTFWKDEGASAATR